MMIIIIRFISHEKMQCVVDIKPMFGDADTLLL